MRSKFAIISSIPTDPPKRAIKSRMEKQRDIKRPWWGMKHIWVIREITRGTTIFLFKNFIKPPDWRLNKGVASGTLQPVLTLNRQRWGWCYKPHRSKVKGANKANLFRIKVRTLGCALGISQECDIVATPDQQPKSKTLLATSKGLAWGSCWRCLSAIFTRQLYSIIKENYMPYSHICITNLAPQLFSSFVHFRWAGAE